ncbi:MAG: hypothetical protein E7Z65_06435 [Thermoplasmata archaeon]|nr:hypothetical protein [Thermoplasmata archaeon]
MTGESEAKYNEIIRKAEDWKNRPSPLQINGEYLPVPFYKGYETVKQEQVNADRSVTGHMFKYRLVEPFKVTIKVKWVALSDAQKNHILSATSANSFTISYVDMETSTVQTADVYRGNDLYISGYGTYDVSTHRFQYYDIEMSLIEL